MSDNQEQPRKPLRRKVENDRPHSSEGEFPNSRPTSENATSIPCAEAPEKSREWRPRTRPTGQRKGSLVKPYCSSIKVNGGPSYSSWKETTSPPFRPNLRRIPEFHPKVVDWRPSRGHPCSRQCSHQPQDFAFIYQPEAVNENTEPPFRPCIRYIPEYHPKGREWRPSRMQMCTSQRAQHNHQQDEDSKTHRSSMKLIKGPQHYSVQHGDVSFRPLEPGHEVLLPPRNQVRKPMAPQGKLNEYIIDGHFHMFKQPKELLTEQRAQFVNCKPQMRQEIFDEVNQAYRENVFRAINVHPSITRHLYEDRTTLVKQEPWNVVGPNLKYLRNYQ